MANAAPITLRIFPLGPLQTNCFVLHTNTQAIVIDPGGSPEPLLDYLKQNNLTLTHILDTHFHIDHIFGNSPLSKATNAPILANPEDNFLLDTDIGKGGFMGLPVLDSFEYEHLNEGTSEFLGLECRVLATPGHTPGSITFYFPQIKKAFTGDLLFYRSIGRTDFPGGSLETLQQSVIQKIFTLPDDVAVYPGHGEETTVGEEKQHNPFFSEFQR